MDSEVETSSAARPFRVGFIGAGGIARTHMLHLSKIPNVEITAATDLNANTLNSVKDEYKIKRVYTDYKQMLADEPEIDAVDICTPNGLHHCNTMAALEAGKHVLVEKPMAMNAREAQEMADKAKATGKNLIVGFQFRFDPRTQLIRRLIMQGKFGKIHFIRCQALRRRGIPNWGVFGRKDLQGGGPMIDIGVHVMEMAHYAIGSPKPLTATGNVWTFHGNQPSDIVSMWPGWDWKTYTVEDMAVGMIRLDGGALMSIEASFVSHIEQDLWTFQIMGEKGGCTWDPIKVFADQDGYMMNIAPAWIPKTGWDSVWEIKMKHFVEVCRDGRHNEASAEDGVMIQKMLDGVYASAEKCHEVVID